MILDLDRPRRGVIRENVGPLETLRVTVPVAQRKLNDRVGLRSNRRRLPSSTTIYARCADTQFCRAFICIYKSKPKNQHHRAKARRQGHAWVQFPFGRGTGQTPRRSRVASTYMTRFLSWRFQPNGFVSHPLATLTHQSASKLQPSYGFS